MPPEEIREARPLHERFSQWLLAKYNLTHPTDWDAANPVVNVIDRSEAQSRHLTNMDEVVSTLSSFSSRVSPVMLGKLGFREQLDTFASTDILIAIHGAALWGEGFPPPLWSDRGSEAVRMRHLHS